MADSVEREIRDLRSLFWSDRDPEGRGFAPLADAYRRAGEFDQALELLNDGLGRHPSFASGHVVAGWVHRDRDSLLEAEASFRTALQLDDENVHALRGLGFLLVHRGKPDQAWKVFSQVSELEPGDPDVEGELARLEAREEGAPGGEAAEIVTAAGADVLMEGVESPEDGLDLSDIDFAAPPGEDEAALEDEEAFGDEEAFEDVGALEDEASFQEETTFEAETALEDEAALGDEPGYEDEVAFEGETALGDEPGYEDEVAFEGETAFGDEPGYEDEVAFEVEAEDEEEAGEEAGAEEIVVAAGADYLMEEPEELEEPDDVLDAAAFGVSDRPDRPGQEYVEGGREMGVLEVELEDLDGPGEEEDLSTRTMAELYARQGLYDRALRVYRRLNEEAPDDAELAERLEQLEAEARAERAETVARSEEDEPPPSTGSSSSYEDDVDAMAEDMSRSPAWDAVDTPFAWSGERDEPGEGPAGEERPVDEYFSALLDWKPSPVEPEEAGAPEAPAAPDEPSVPAAPEEPSVPAAPETDVLDIGALAPDEPTGPRETEPYAEADAVDIGTLAPDEPAVRPEELPDGDATVVPIASLAPEADEGDEGGDRRDEVEEDDFTRWLNQLR